MLELTSSLFGNLDVLDLFYGFFVTFPLGVFSLYNSLSCEDGVVTLFFLSSWFNEDYPAEIFGFYFLLSDGDIDWSSSFNSWVINAYFYVSIFYLAF